MTKHLSVDFDRLHSAWSNEEKRTLWKLQQFGNVSDFSEHLHCFVGTVATNSPTLFSVYFLGGGVGVFGRMISHYPWAVAFFC